jgi:hypothetical protein
MPHVLIISHVAHERTLRKKKRKRETERERQRERERKRERDRERKRERERGREDASRARPDELCERAPLDPRG